MKRNYIAGEWVEGRNAAENINPSDTRDVIGLFARADAAQAEAAIAAAHAAQPQWAAATPQRRSEALDAVGNEILARKDELGDLLAREEGKTLSEATAEVIRAGQIFRFFAGEALRQTGGNQLRAAQLLGINRNTLRKRLSDLAIDPVELQRV